MKLGVPLLLSSFLVSGSLAQDNSTTTNITTPTYPNAGWSDLLNATLYFYEYQKAGYLGSNFPIPWRHDSGLEDGADQNVDLVGGYYDAGDYLKFTMPLVYSLTIIAWGGIDWSDGYRLSGQAANLGDKLKWGMDWVIKAHPSPNVTFVQVGDGNVDNNYWGPDTGIPTPRPSFQVNATHPGTDIVAQQAASFAAASIIFRKDSPFQNVTYADILLQHAKDAFNFAETATPYTPYTTSVPASKSFYQALNYGDKLVWASLWLYRATNSSTYLDKASNFFDTLSVAGSTAAMDWSDQSGGAYVLGAMLDPNNQKYAKEAERYLDSFVNQKSCSFTPGGLLYCDGQSSTNSIVVAADVAFLALMYSPLNPQKNSSYTAFANKQLNYILGDNPELTPYICGIHHNSPLNPHHAGASGGTDINNIGSPAVSLHVLYGAVVGGPSKTDSFDDDRANYDQSEVALDYNAPLTALAAYQVINNYNDPYYISLPAFTSRPKLSSSSGLPAWLYFVIVAAVVIFAQVVLIAIAWRYCGLRRWWAKKRGKMYEMGYVETKA